MSSEYAAKLAEAVRAVAPLLRERGFKKQRNAFNRESEPGLVQVITFQMGAHQPPGTVEIPGLRESLYGAFTINLGLHFDEVRELGRLKPRGKFVREGECHVTTRIGNLLRDGADVWWKLDLPEDELRTLVRQLISDRALPFLDRFDSRGALLDGWHNSDPNVRYTPAFTIAVIHATRGDTAVAEELIAAELRETERPGTRKNIIDAAQSLGLRIAR